MSNFKKYLNKVRIHNYSEATTFEKTVVEVPMTTGDVLDKLGKMMSNIGKGIIGAPKQLYNDLTKDPEKSGVVGNILVDFKEKIKNAIEKSIYEVDQMYKKTNNTEEQKKIATQKTKLFALRNEINAIKEPNDGVYRDLP